MNTTGARPIPHRVTKVKPLPPRTGHGKTSTTVIVTGNHHDSDALSPAGIATIVIFTAALLLCLFYLVAKH